MPTPEPPLRISKFTVRNQRSVRLAACETCPPLMIVTGPNGCGKSTLLMGLRGVGGGSGPVLYVGPHRTSRRQTVRARFLFAAPIRMQKLLSETNLSNYEGITISSRQRDAWDFDEANSYLKYSLCQIELERQDAISNRLDADGEIPKGTIPDIWKPLRDMTANLLPHLRFSRIDVSNRDQIRCLWSVHTKDVVVDIDELSSGEKAIIQLFFPLIEGQVQDLIRRCRAEPAEAASGSICVLMDEPELHLHPLLQVKVLDYLRKQAVEQKTQFIVATHSPTIVENASSDELFLLRPSELVQGDENQLVRIATDEDKLVMLREVFGSTSNITGMRPMLVVEGERETLRSRQASDARIYGFLNDRFSQLTLVPGGGRGECEALVSRINDALAAFSPHIRAHALLDRDLAGPADAGDSVTLLPVSMVENLLVDPDVIWEALRVVEHKTKFRGPEDVEKALDAVLDSMTASEVDRRVKGAIGVRRFRLEDPVAEVKRQVEKFVVQIQAEFTEDAIRAVQAESQKVVEEIRNERRRREHFHGKQILKEFYSSHLQATGMSREIFIYECARQASKRASVQTFLKDLFDKLLPAAKEKELDTQASDAATPG